MTSKFDFFSTKIQDLFVLQRKPACDGRGYFERMFCLSDLGKHFSGKRISQINHTQTQKIGSVRGMHFQNQPHAEIKFVSCVKGEVFDVAVDLRSESPTFLQWHSEVLSAKNHKTLMIPEGFAHGFQTLSNDCELLYFHSNYYHAPSEDGLNVRDPRLAIDWPMPIANLSKRDEAFPMLEANFNGVIV